MLERSSDHHIPAPCIIETGILVNKRDMLRLLGDLTQVRYVELLDGEPQAQGEAYLVEVFSDSHQSTILANHSLYLNVASFDYLELKPIGQSRTQFELVQDNRRLRLIPLNSPLAGRSSDPITDESLESMLVQVISAKLDAQIDDMDDWSGS
ncbi:MAG: hypothetical protein HLUCCO16_07495 [Phormidium sp. OSCR]|jgi:hypothetical protein|nr:MAG: hypothetical protein HLUCCO16_07495 [Phormidium sp. OSCR]